MINLPTLNEYKRIVLDNIPLIDVRAPVEFNAGAFPMAVNLPIMDDEDRHLVGICYKQNGKDAAFNLAYKRVSGLIKEDRLNSWSQFHAKNPEAVLYCFRGGMRSKTAQEWLLQRGKELYRLEGGYKAFRRYLIEALDPANIKGVPVILGGRTGTGKTLLLRQLDNSIDLEDIAHHRGSTFGGFLTPQPNQIDFENRLSYELIQHGHKGYRHIVLEDEGSYIGARYIPHDLARYFKRDSMVLLECGLPKRIKLTHNEYVVDAQEEYLHAYGTEKGLFHWFEYIQARLHRIRKRLGGERLKRVMQMLRDGYEEQLSSGNQSKHCNWIEMLLTEYYDPMYDYQIEKSGRKIVFQGEFDAVLEYLNTLEGKSSC